MERMILYMIVPKIPSVILSVEPIATNPPIAIAIYVNMFIIILFSMRIFCIYALHIFSLVF
jgi:hypothetical protein